jgi:hypothetical protein
VAKARKKPPAQAGAAGFLALLLGALLWKLGVLGGDGGPAPTDGGAGSRPTPFGAESRPATRATESAPTTRRAPRFRVDARVVTRATPPAPVLGRRVALFESGALRALAEAVSGVDGVAALDVPPDAEKALRAGELIVRFADGASEAARGVPAPPLGAGENVAVRAIAVTLEDDAETPPPTEVDAASRPTSRGTEEEILQPPNDPDPPTGAGKIRGRLVERDGAPIAGRALKLVVFRPLGAGDAGGTTIEVATDRRGAFEATAPPGRRVLVELRAQDGRGDHRAPFVARADVLDAARPLDFGDVRLAREAELCRGRVVDAAGAPVAVAAVVLRPPGVDADAVGVRSGADGTFVVRGPEDLASFEAFAETEDLAGRAPGELRRGARDVVVTLGPAGSVEGRVTTPDPSVLSVVDLALYTPAGARVATARPRKDGAFRFVHVAPGLYTVAATAPGTPDVRVETDVGGGRVSLLSDLATARNYGVRRVTVADAAGNPIAGAAVEARLKQPEGARIAVRSDAKGRAVLHLPPGVETPLVVAADGFATRELEGSAAADIHVVLRAR